MQLFLFSFSKNPSPSAMPWNATRSVTGIYKNLPPQNAEEDLFKVVNVN